MADQLPELDVVIRFSLILCISIRLICYPAEFLRPQARVQRVRRSRWLPSRPAEKTLRRLLWLPLFSWSLCGLLGFVSTFLHPSDPQSELECSTNVVINPDIGGIGVRIALYATMGMTIMSLVLGAFGYRSETGTKELGAALLVSK